MKIDKFIEKALLKMFKAVGAEKEFSLDYCKKENWFTQYTWKADQVEKYKTWFLKNAMKDLRLTKKGAEREWSYFFLQWGWKQEYDNRN